MAQAPLVFLGLLVLSSAHKFPRPDVNDGALMSRWLAHVTMYGVLATLEDGKPFGGIVSHSDGSQGHPTGRLFFYLAPMGELPTNAASDPHVSFTVAEAQLPGGCNSVGGEPEEPTCAKVTFMGKFLPVDKKDQDEVYDAMVKRHPKMADWAANAPSHDFTLYELQISQIHLLDNFGGMKSVSTKDYFNARLEEGGQGQKPMSAGASDSDSESSGSESHSGSESESESEHEHAGASISFGNMFGASILGTVCGMLLLGVAALGVKVYLEKVERKQYCIALSNSDIK